MFSPYRHISIQKNFSLFYYQNELKKTDCVRKNKELVLSAPTSKIEAYCSGVLTGLQPFKLPKSADVSYLPRGNGFVCGPETPPFCLAGILRA